LIVQYNYDFIFGVGKSSIGYGGCARGSLLFFFIPTNDELVISNITPILIKIQVMFKICSHVFQTMHRGIGNHQPSYRILWPSIQ
jgi:hypothetical protein